jgi:hypothetical protein
MKKLIFCCLVLLMGAGACKDDDKVEPDVDFANEFVGNFATSTAVTNFTSAMDWVVTSPGKNQLNIVFTKKSRVEVPQLGSFIDVTQVYKLSNVKVTAADKIEIDETVDVEQNVGGALQQKLEGTGTKVINGAGIPQINITLKMRNTANGKETEEYLEFKKQ